MTPRALSECRAVITGGTSGVGLAAARGLAAAGAPSILLLGRDAARGEAAAASVEAPDVVFRSVDAEDPAACADAVAFAQERFGGIDVLINSVASAHYPELALRTPAGDARAIVTSHLLPPLHMTLAALPVMSAQESGGSIVNVASDAGKTATPGEALIGAAMAGTIMFTRTIAIEAKRSGVRANVLTPSLIDGTPTGEAVQASGFGVKLFAKARQLAELGVPDADDVAALIVFLAGPESAKLTGQAISVNGGISAA